MQDHERLYSSGEARLNCLSLGIYLQNVLKLKKSNVIQLVSLVISQQNVKDWKTMQNIIRINFVIFSHCHYKILFMFTQKNVLFDLSIILMPRY